MRANFRRFNLLFFFFVFVLVLVLLVVVVPCCQIARLNLISMRHFARDYFLVFQARRCVIDRMSVFLDVHS